MSSATDDTSKSIVERVDGIAAWINDLDARVRAAELATGDEKTARELRRTVEALSKHDPKLEKRLTNRVDVLADRLATLAATVSTTAASLVRKDGEIAALRKDLDDGNKRLESLVREFGKSAGAEEVEKLRAAIRAVQAERPARTSDARVENLGAKVDYLTERIDTLAKTVGTTAAGLVGREGEIATLRQGLDESSARMEQTSAELRRMRGDGSLGRRVDAVQAELDTTNARLVDRETEVDALRSRIDEAYSRVGTVVAELQTSLARLTSQVGGLAALPEATEQALDAQATELACRIDAATAEVREAIAQLPAPGSVEGEVGTRLEQLGALLAAVTQQIGALEESSSAHAEATAARATALEGLLATGGERLQRLESDREALAARVEELAAAVSGASETESDLMPLLETLNGRLATMESGNAAAAAEITRLSSALDAERDAVRAELETLAGATTSGLSKEDAERMLADVSSRLHSLEDGAGAAASEQQLAQLSARLEAVEDGGAAIASEMARTAALWVSELESIEARLDRVSGTLGQGATGVRAESEQLLAELPGRLDAMERARRAVETEVARVSDSWQTERADVDAQLAEIATQLAQAQSRATASSEDEVAQLRIAFDGLRQRLASSEQELASLAGTKDSGTRLDELTRRLESLERAPVVLAGTPDGNLVPGDGRFRLELRALELRMEHAEAAARENREAVLVQLERLAARIEWRFQRLESEQEDARPQAVGGGGQVVPLRPKPESS